jgi:hypothetical protein
MQELHHYNFLCQNPLVYLCMQGNPSIYLHTNNAADELFPVLLTDKIKNLGPISNGETFTSRCNVGSHWLDSKSYHTKTRSGQNIGKNFLPKHWQVLG